MNPSLAVRGSEKKRVAVGLAGRTSAEKEKKKAEEAKEEEVLSAKEKSRTPFLA